MSAVAVEGYREIGAALLAALHGLAELERSGRIRPGARTERIQLLVQALAAARGGPPGLSG